MNVQQKIRDEQVKFTLGFYDDHLPIIEKFLLENPQYNTEIQKRRKNQMR
ncbi:hypothetical protein pb186bvf_015870 [Paramecium bursaria]